jgi:hypothetical protein
MHPATRLIAWGRLLGGAEDQHDSGSLVKYFSKTAVNRNVG